jgi:hypothetical protein
LPNGLQTDETPTKEEEMAHISISPDAEGAWPEFRNKSILHVQDFKIGGLRGGMQSGKASVAIMFELPTGQVVFAETSLALFLTAADALKAKWGDPRQSKSNEGQP